MTDLIVTLVYTAGIFATLLGLLAVALADGDLSAKDWPIIGAALVWPVLWALVLYDCVSGQRRRRREARR